MGGAGGGESHVKIDIYNIKGQKVTTLLNEIRKPGVYNIVWNGIDDNGKNVGSGIYFYKMTTAEYTSTRRMIMLK